MKKILVLGGARSSIPQIKKAREMGLHVITCDYRQDNPGHKFAHEYYNVSTTDKDAVLALAQKLRVSAVVCHDSDSSASTVAYVREKMGFSTSPYKSVEILTNKDKFRQFLKEHNFNTPKARGYSDIKDAMDEIGIFKKPCLIKPVDSSGSRGVTLLRNSKDLENQIKYALQFSLVKRFIIEEYVEKDGYQLAGDGFSVDGKLVFRCFANEHFDAKSEKNFVPIGESWPYIKPKSVHSKIHNEIQRLLTLLDMKTGAYNFDIRLDKDENVYLMELGPRNGGNLIAQVIKYATGVDLIEYNLKAAIGMNCTDLRMMKPKGFWSSYVIHSHCGGILRDICIDEKFKKENLIEFEAFCKPGDKVESFTGANFALGMAIVKYNSSEEMMDKMEDMERYVKFTIDNENRIK
jgi:biotin carboxylase